MNVACSRYCAWQTPLFSFLLRLDQASEYKCLRMIISSSPGPELGNDASSLEKAHTFSIGLVFLSIICPVGVHKSEVGFAGQSQERDLVENRFNPQALDREAEFTMVIVTSGIFLGREGGFDLIARVEAELFKEIEIGFVQIGASILQEAKFVV